MLLLSASIAAQGRQGGAPPTARAAAPIDLTGTWVSVVTEDWRWRMRTPPKGDYASVPLNEAGTKAADAWDPAKDTAAGEQCRGYGAAAVMRMPGRIRISWDNDTTLKIETEAGTQTRLLNFVAPAQRGEPSWQGASIANWQFAGGGRRAACHRRAAGHCASSRPTCARGICERTASRTAQTLDSLSTSTALQRRTVMRGSW